MGVPTQRHEHDNPEEGRAEFIDTLRALYHVYYGENGVVVVDVLQVERAYEIGREHHLIEALFLAHESMFWDDGPSGSSSDGYRRTGRGSSGSGSSVGLVDRRSIGHRAWVQRIGRERDSSGRVGVRLALGRERWRQRGRGRGESWGRRLEIGRRDRGGRRPKGGDAPQQLGRLAGTQGLLELQELLLDLGDTGPFVGPFVVGLNVTPKSLFTTSGARVGVFFIGIAFGFLLTTFDTADFLGFAGFVGDEGGTGLGGRGVGVVAVELAVEDLEFVRDVGDMGQIIE